MTVSEIKSKITKAPSLRWRLPWASRPPRPTTRRSPPGEKAQHRAMVSKVQDRATPLVAKSQRYTTASSPTDTAKEASFGCAARPASLRSEWPAEMGASCKDRPSFAEISKSSAASVPTRILFFKASQQSECTAKLSPPRVATSKVWMTNKERVHSCTFPSVEAVARPGELRSASAASSSVALRVRCLPTGSMAVIAEACALCASTHARPSHTNKCPDAVPVTTTLPGAQTQRMACFGTFLQKRPRSHLYTNSSARSFTALPETESSMPALGASVLSHQNVTWSKPHVAKWRSPMNLASRTNSSAGTLAANTRRCVRHS
mmetsp:Transcript_8148/g.26739  ORF Transcript_8148/g.26739 Transcript_8148/m.26739 type:complete len:319 (-) Transcript_8148:45-1001(-)